jgi:hypothetical protein
VDDPHGAVRRIIVETAPQAGSEERVVFSIDAQAGQKRRGP